MAGWHHWLNGRESEWTPGVGDGQGGLACCDSWGCKESDKTVTDVIWSDIVGSFSYIFSPVQFSSISHVWLFLTPWIAARLPCPSLTPGVCSNSYQSSRWCHQPSHPLSSPSISAFSLSWHQILLQWVSYLYQVAKIFEFQLQHQSFRWIFRTDFI